MYIFLLIAFIIGYICIALEHPLKIDKAASAILTGVICWTILVIGQNDIFLISQESRFIEDSILHHIGEIAEILFFLLAAMTIVELIDSHGGFQIITSRVKTTNKIRLLWILSIVTFILSSVLDNLTSTIVMATLLKQLIKDKNDLWFFGGMVVIAANAGGAWSPIGDVTTIMLWIGGQVTATNIITSIILPSICCLFVPLIILSFTQKGEITHPINFDHDKEEYLANSFESNLVLLISSSPSVVFKK